MEVKQQEYGSWVSEITTEMLVGDAVRLGGVALAGDEIYWVEGRPSEAGRCVLVCQSSNGHRQDLTPAPFSVRTRVHEYGGDAFHVADGVVWFCNDADQRIYSSRAGESPVALTNDGPHRYADFSFDAVGQRLLCVRESAREGGGEPANELVAVSLDSGAVTVLAEGSDFYASPRFDPVSRRIVWLSWGHPNMPWDGTELWIADLSIDGHTGKPQLICGGESEAVFQPTWSADGKLYLITEREGWWNLHRWTGNGVECVCTLDAEFGLPLWQLGMRTFGFADSDRIICTYAREACWQLAVLTISTGELRELDCGYSEFDALTVVKNRVCFIGGSPDRPAALVSLNLESGRSETVQSSVTIELDHAWLSKPAAISFPTEDGDYAHGFFYRPVNPGFVGPEDGLPPLMVIGHGGPTGSTSTTLSLGIQFWTSRGFAVLDVNYRGSTGYGRAYRDSLRGAWGVADVADCVRGAQYLVTEKLVDPRRLVIRGGSAGGYTALAALTFHDTFAAGASYYGISELESLARDTHKFESRYLDSLIGPYPQDRDVYRARSPIHATQQLSCPVIFFQGLEDKVVPPNQAEVMVAALREKGLPVAYLAFAGEQHGFRHAETIKRTLEAELYFYGQVLGFAPAGNPEPVPIANLDRR